MTGEDAIEKEFNASPVSSYHESWIDIMCMASMSACSVLSSALIIFLSVFKSFYSF